MIADLAEVDLTGAPYDICIVGGGTAGLMAAALLSRAGRRVVVLEAGGMTTETGSNAFDVRMKARRHEGAQHGRGRGLGGTSTLWGGLLIRRSPGDFLARPHAGQPAWPVGWDELLPHYRRVEALFGLEGAGDEPPWPQALAGDAAFTPRIGPTPSFRMRNTAHVFHADLARPGGPQVCLNATVTGFRRNEAGAALTGVEARDRAGAAVTVRAHRFIIAAGLFETTRLLLWDAARHPGPATQDRGLGGGFNDHLSAPAGVVTPVSRARLERRFAPRFKHGGLRLLRYEATAELQAQLGGLSFFFHVPFQHSGASAFDLVRRCMQAVQARRWPGLGWGDLGTLARGLPYFANLGVSRFAHGRLAFPSDARFELRVDLEQAPDPASRLLLDPQTAASGVPRLALDWRVTAREEEGFRAAMGAAEQFWTDRSAETGGTLTLDPRLLSGELGLSDIAEDAFHAAGTTPMATGAASGAVDSNLRVLGLDNLYVASTSVFPTSGSANPTHTLLALTSRLCDHLLAAKS